MSQTTDGTKETEPTVEFRINDLDDLLESATHVQHATDLVITPVDLHRRHLKGRLAAAGQPLDAFDFVGGGDVATCLLDQAGRRTRSLDRVDRLDALRDILADPDGPRKHFEDLFGGEPTAQVKDVEQIRSELEAITNYHPTRVRAYRELADTLAAPVAADACDALDGAHAVEVALRNGGVSIPTTTELLRRATRRLVRDGADFWEAGYPHVERVVLAGLSNVSAPLVDLLTAIAQATDVQAAIYLRQATGPDYRDRLPQTLVPDPGEVVTR